VGYFYLGVSDVLKQSAQPLAALGDEHGVELYYNARVTPWLQVTPDLQIIKPFQQQADTAVVVGVRARIDF
jgi:porin